MAMLLDENIALLLNVRSHQSLDRHDEANIQESCKVIFRGKTSKRVNLHLVLLDIDDYLLE